MSWYDKNGLNSASCLIFEDYIDYYNKKRIKGELKGMSTVQYRVHFQAA